MPNFVKLFQDEVRRLARKESKGELGRLRKENLELRKALSNLKRKTASVEKQLSALARSAGAAAGSLAESEEEPAAGERARISANTIRTLRQKLGLTQAEFAKLLGVSGQSVYQWERQDGRLKLRRATRRAVVEAKGMGVRQARARLQEL
ncbi:MAG: helix-turn-helix domain-containing protein [Candidatus Hydrogenedentes bacterium]|nr:helix-turn-helix domain-containing protein [Candidatus Hydrogenedentota bacterium]MBI3118725.1 helix-turn-helix domain-containing protein [Candidatus Hydrogenedentota bacterium]